MKKTYVVGKLAKPSVIKSTFQWNYLKIIIIIPIIIFLSALLILIFGSKKMDALICVGASVSFFVFICMGFVLVNTISISGLGAGIGENYIVIKNKKLIIFTSERHTIEIDLNKILDVTVVDVNAHFTNVVSEIFDSIRGVNGNVTIVKNYKYKVEDSAYLKILYLSGDCPTSEVIPYKVEHPSQVIERIFKHIEQEESADE